MVKESERRCQAMTPQTMVSTLVCITSHGIVGPTSILLVRLQLLGLAPMHVLSEDNQ